MDLITLLSEVLEIDADHITDDLRRTACAEWTSLKHVELMVTLEEVYGVSFTSRQMAEVNDVRNLRVLLVSKNVSLHADEARRPARGGLARGDPA
jgi:acyl carrier protein